MSINNEKMAASWKRFEEQSYLKFCLIQPLRGGGGVLLFPVCEVGFSVANNPKKKKNVTKKNANNTLREGLNTGKYGPEMSKKTSKLYIWPIEQIKL